MPTTLVCAGYVHRYFVYIGILAILTEIGVPLTLSFMALVRPCMPPLASSMLNCNSWHADSDIGILCRIVVAILEAYTWKVNLGIIAEGMFVVLLYPGEVALLLINTLETWAENNYVCNCHDFNLCAHLKIADTWKQKASFLCVDTAQYNYWSGCKIVFGEMEEWPSALGALSKQKVLHSTFSSLQWSV